MAVQQTLTASLHSAARFASLAALAMLTVIASVSAATGGPDGYGHEWADDTGGCSTDVPAWGPGLAVLDDVPLDDWVGPLPIGFVLPFYGQPVTELWISPHGYVVFSAQDHVADPQVLPDPAGPNDLVAAHWVGAEALHVANLRHEALVDAFHVEWEQWVGPTWARVSTHLWLHPDGSLRMTWQAYDEDFGVLVGYEDAAGARGVTLLQRAEDGTLLGRDGAFPDAAVGRSACIQPPPAPGVLDCSMAEPIGCGPIGSASPAMVPTNVELYGCGTRTWRGNERVFVLELSELTDIDLSLEAAGRDLAVFLLSACNEYDCLDGGGLIASARSLPPGSYLVVVDAADASQHGPFTLDVTCRPVSEPIACEASMGGTTVAGLSRLDAHGCSAGDFSGPEAYYLLDFAGPGNIDVSVSSKPRLSYTRRATIAGQYAMSAKRALRPPFSEEMQWHALRPESEGERGMAESIYFGLNSPAKRLEVEVVFPKNYRLLEPRVRVLPDAVYQFEALEDLRPRVHARGLVLSVDEEASTLKLTVTRPLLGLSYALSWLLP